ncbi:LysR substrate-binding domain-containing protein [Rhizobium sp. BK068]|uniref:LysR substrate-binding domain-containing protein n=1 Tax=Rhizobium sp. BK068 TaxID=2512130 RepID=UPI001FE1562D|nr:LysR substrate-binding domain-containing protein [Rhizobium sp. BK068]
MRPSRDQWHFDGRDEQMLAAKINSNIAIDNGEAMRVAAVEDAGIIYAPEVLVADDITAGRLTEVLASWGKHSLPIHAVHPSRQFVPRRVKAIVHWIAGDLRR